MEKIKTGIISLATDKVIFTSLISLSFVIPLTLGHSQFLTGSLVNTLLFLSAIFLKGRLYWPVIFLPSLAVLAKGLIFGPFTYLLVFMLPAIWIGNFLLIFIFKKMSPIFNYPISIIFSALGKQVFLFSFTLFLFNFKVLPAIFLQTMGVNQLLTALLGGFMTWLILKKFNNGRAEYRS